MKKLSIGVRLTLWYLAFFAVAQLLFGVGMWLILRDNVYDLVDDHLEEQIDDLKNFLLSQPKDRSIAKLREEVNETYAIEHSGSYLELYSENGEPIYRSEFLQAHPSALTPVDQVNQPTLQSRKIEGHQLRFILQKLDINGHVYVVEMGAPAEDAAETLHQFRSYLLMFAPVLLVAAAGGGYWLSRRALSPVDALVRTAREISGTNLNTRLQKLETGDELQRLSDTLNEMLDRIESAFLRITEFTADASHELRTPVSLIRTEAELALRRSRGEGEYKESLRHILLEAERTTVLIEQLLSLARADSARERLPLQPVDLHQTMRSVVGGWQQVATIRNLQFSAGLEVPDLFVLGDETLLRRLTDILLDNAFKYTSAPGSVQLSLGLEGESAVITVKDSGVGIPEDEQSRIFERFYRVDKARSRAHGGAGLGLAIAHWIVTHHGGSIGVESRLGEGATFRVELPMIATPAMPLKNTLPA
jgi:two-component system, OmpR family, heavy metal sensor histidine kinase CusS